MNGSRHDIHDDDLFVCPFTFMGIPYSHDLSDSRAAILGIPFDCGTHPARIGARQGPQAIREQSRLPRPYQPPAADFDVQKRLGVVDSAAAGLTPGVLPAALRRPEEGGR